MGRNAVAAAGLVAFCLVVAQCSFGDGREASDSEVRDDDDMITIDLSHVPPLPVPVDVEFTDAGVPDDQLVRLSAGFGWIATGDRVLITNDRGVSWRTYPDEVGGPGGRCLNSNDEHIVDVRTDSEDNLRLVFQNPNGDRSPAGVTSALLTVFDRFAAASSFCRPAFVDGRWAVAASDGSNLMIASTADLGTRLDYHIVELPAGSTTGQTGGFVDLFADGGNFVARICGLNQSVCQDTRVTFAASSLETASELVIHRVEAGETVTQIAEQHDLLPRDVIQANPLILDVGNLIKDQPMTIPILNPIRADDVVVSSPFVQGHPALFEGDGETWQVVALDVDDDPELFYGQPGVFGAGPWGEEPVAFPAIGWRVDVYPRRDGAFARVFTARASDEDSEQTWYAWGDREWVSISVDPVRDWPTLSDWEAAVTFVEVAPSGRIRVIPDLASS